MPIQNSINKESIDFETNILTTEHINIDNGAGFDCFLKFSNGTFDRYSIGNDGSDSDKFKINSSASPSSGSEAIVIDPTSANAINFYNEYTFPTADGALNEMLTTDGAGNLSWSAGPAPTTGRVVQTVFVKDFATKGIFTTQIPKDNTKPLITEGTEVLTTTITPLSADNTVIVKVDMHIQAYFGSPQVLGVVIASLFRSDTAEALATTWSQAGYIGSAQARANKIFLTYNEKANSAAPITYSVRVGLWPCTGTTTNQFCLNGYITSGGISTIFGGTLFSTIGIYEISE